jgi:hypothetical protein
MQGERGRRHAGPLARWEQVAIGMFMAAMAAVVIAAALA